MTRSVPKVHPPSRERSKTIPRGPAQATYTSPPGPTAGTAPSTVSSLSTAFPPLSEIRMGTEKLSPPSTDREKRIWVESLGFLLPYTSNRVQATYTLPRWGESWTLSVTNQGLSSKGFTVLMWSTTGTGSFQVKPPSSDRVTKIPFQARAGRWIRIPSKEM